MSRPLLSFSGAMSASAYGLRWWSSEPENKTEKWKNIIEGRESNRGGRELGGESAGGVGSLVGRSRHETRVPPAAHVNPITIVTAADQPASGRHPFRQGTFSVSPKHTLVAIFQSHSKGTLGSLKEHKNNITPSWQYLQLLVVRDTVKSDFCGQRYWIVKIHSTGHSPVMSCPFQPYFLLILTPNICFGLANLHNYHMLPKYHTVQSCYWRWVNVQ